MTMVSPVDIKKLPEQGPPVNRMTRDNQKAMYWKAILPLVGSIIFLVPFVVFSYNWTSVAPAIEVDSKLTAFPIIQYPGFVICIASRAYFLMSLIYIIYKVHIGSDEAIEQARSVGFILRFDLLGVILNATIFICGIVALHGWKIDLILAVVLIHLAELLNMFVWGFGLCVYDGLQCSLMNDEERKEHEKNRIPLFALI